MIDENRHHCMHALLTWTMLSMSVVTSGVMLRTRSDIVDGEVDCYHMDGAEVLTAEDDLPNLPMLNGPENGVNGQSCFTILEIRPTYTDGHG